MISQRASEDIPDVVKVDRNVYRLNIRVECDRLKHLI